MRTAQGSAPLLLLLTAIGGRAPLLRNTGIRSLPQGFATMRATIDVTGTKIDVAAPPPALRARINTEKPQEDKIIVRRPGER